MGSGKNESWHGYSGARANAAPAGQGRAPRGAACSPPKPIPTPANLITVKEKKKETCW